MGLALWLMPLVFLVSARAALQSFDNLDALIKSGNLSHPPWFYTGQKLDVTLDIHLSELRDVDTEHLEIVLGYFRHMNWNDERLKYIASLTNLSPYIPWEPSFRNTVWTPDIHVSNAANTELHAAPSTNMIYRLYPNGTIFESAMISSTFICKRAPVYPSVQFDCRMRFESYGYTNKELELHWKAKVPQSRIDFFSAPTFKLKHITLLENCSDSRHYIGTYSCIEISMKVYQEFQPFVTEIFVPSTLIVFAAGMSFWIDKASVPARTSLGGTCVIASVTHSTGLVLGMRHNIEWHSVNIWLNTCIVFVVTALLEFGLVHSLVRRANRNAQESNGGCASPGDNQGDENETRVDGCGQNYFTIQRQSNNKLDKSETPAVSEKKPLLARHKRAIHKIKSNPGKIDTVMRVLYPALFVAFAVCYWMHFTKTD